MEKCRTERERHLNMVFTTAIEGGINYWAEITTYKWSAPDPDGFDGRSEARDFYADVIDTESDDQHAYRIDASVIRGGINLAYQFRKDIGDDYQRQAITDLNFGKWDDVDYDADTADMIVQFALFGELVYG